MQMDLPNVAEGWSGSVNQVVLGATKDEDGTRGHTITIGGEKTIPYMSFEGDIGGRTLTAMDVIDVEPTDWPDALVEPIRDVIGDPAAWAKKCIDEFGAELICLKLDGIHPDKGDKDAGHAVEVVKSVLEAVSCPLIIWGSEDDGKDNEIMPKVSEAAKGENCLLGTAKEGNYKRITASALADGHCLIALAPLDINIAKQVNILISDMGFPLERIVMFQTTGALGYGLEYAYSIQERERIAALSGDKTMAMPVICDVGYESWKAKEAKTIDDEAPPEWGAQAERAVAWETVTAVTLMQSGVDVLRLRHPSSVAAVKRQIEELVA